MYRYTLFLEVLATNPYQKKGMSQKNIDTFSPAAAAPTATAKIAQEEEVRAVAIGPNHCCWSASVPPANLCWCLYKKGFSVIVVHFYSLCAATQHIRQSINRSSSSSIRSSSGILSNNSSRSYWRNTYKQPQWEELPVSASFTSSAVLQPCWNVDCGY